MSPYSYLPATGVAKMLASMLTDWQGPATVLAREMLTWYTDDGAAPVITINVTARENRKLTEKEASLLNAPGGTECHCRTGQMLARPGTGDSLIIADTKLTLLVPRLPREVVPLLGGNTPLGALLEPHGVTRVNRIALAPWNELNERGKKIAVRSSATVACRLPGGLMPVAVAAEVWGMGFCEAVRRRDPRHIFASFP